MLVFSHLNTGYPLDYHNSADMSITLYNHSSNVCIFIGLSYTHDLRRSLVDTHWGPGVYDAYLDIIGEQLYPDSSQLDVLRVGRKSLAGDCTG